MLEISSAFSLRIAFSLHFMSAYAINKFSLLLAQLLVFETTTRIYSMFNKDDVEAGRHLENYPNYFSHSSNISDLRSFSPLA